MHSIRHIAQSMIEAKLFLQLSFIAFRPPCQCAYLFLPKQKAGHENRAPPFVMLFSEAHAQAR